MRSLIDTHALLWWVAESARLSGTACTGRLAGAHRERARRISRLATAATASGRRVYYGTLTALLVVAEIGYLRISQDGAVLVFQLINAATPDA